MNLMNRFLIGGKTRGGMGASKRVKTLSLPTSDILTGTWLPISLSCSLIGLIGRLTQELRQMVQDPGAIAKNGDLNIIFLNKLANLLSI